MRDKLMTLFFLAIMPLTAAAQVASSPNFTLEKVVIAPGGQSAGPTHRTSGGAGQPASGLVAGPTFQIQGGFWQQLPFAPTAANVSIYGRVMTADGRGINNAVVFVALLTGETFRARTNGFGYYSVAGIPAGQTVVVGVNAKLYQFEPRMLNLDDSLTDVDFTASGNAGREN